MSTRKRNINSSDESDDERLADAQDDWANAKTPAPRTAKKPRRTAQTFAKVLSRDNVKTIPKQALVRVSRRAGFSRISKVSMDKIYALIKTYITSIANTCHLLLEMKNTKANGTKTSKQHTTITVAIANEALKKLGMIRVINLDNIEPAVRSKDGRAIVSADRVIPVKSFSDVFRYAVGLKGDGIRISKNAFYVVQIAVEAKINIDLVVLKTIASYYNEKTLLEKHLDLLDSINIVLSTGKVPDDVFPEVDSEEEIPLSKTAVIRRPPKNKPKATKTQQKTNKNGNILQRNQLAKTTATIPKPKPKKKAPKRKAGRPGQQSKKKLVYKKN